mmetsp:Transcript_16600/g.48121  ORF Transcript_16600/g.48121 Transcript_16600/m.48121 type:complete len:224 (-) Transcript_16600:382-1053(-)
MSGLAPHLNRIDKASAATCAMVSSSPSPTTVPSKDASTVLASAAFNAETTSGLARIFTKGAQLATRHALAKRSNAFAMSAEASMATTFSRKMENINAFAIDAGIWHKICKCRSSNIAPTIALSALCGKPGRAHGFEHISGWSVLSRSPVEGFFEVSASFPATHPDNARLPLCASALLPPLPWMAASALSGNPPMSKLPFSARLASGANIDPLGVSRRVEGVRS